MPRLIAALVAITLSTALRVQAQGPITLTQGALAGCSFCEGPELFGSVMGLAIGGGRLVVADRDAPHLRIFDLDGALLGTAGGEGEGPGEMRLPLAVSVSEEDIVALDMRLSRMMRVDFDGAELGAERLGGFPLAAAFVKDGKGLYVSLADFRNGEARVRHWGEDTGWTDLLDSVAGLRLRPPGEPPMFFSLAAGGDGGFVIGVGAETYRLLYFDASGQQTREVVHYVERVQKTEEEIEAERETRGRLAARFRDSPEGGPSDAPEIDPLRIHFAQDALRIDSSNRLWVRSARGTGETIFDIFDSDGVHLGEVSIPMRVGAFALGDGLLATVVLDEMDVATVIMWAVDAGDS